VRQSVGLSAVTLSRSGFLPTADVLDVERNKLRPAFFIQYTSSLRVVNYCPRTKANGVNYMKSIILFVTCLLFAVPAFAQSTLVNVMGSQLSDSRGTSGGLLNNATITFAPVLSDGTPASFRRGSGSGQVVITPVSTGIINGSFSLTVADTSLTNPQNICYNVTITDNVTGASLLGSGYSCVQPSNTQSWCGVSGAVTTCNFDSYDANIAPLAQVEVGVTGPPGPIGPIGPAGTITSTGVSGGFAVPGILQASNLQGNVNRYQSPSAQGVISQGSTSIITVTGTASSGSISVSSASDFVVKNGVMIAHAGAPCGSVKGGGCTSPPSPSVVVHGTPGSMTYTYRLSCVDGLGGVGAAGTGGTTSVGAATLAGVVLANTVSGNYNAVTWTGNSSCFEVAIYRNGSLIATEYSAPSGTMTYNDIGVTAWINRDLPAAPPTIALNDNYIGMITAIGTTTATVSPALGAAVAGATLYHSDTPLIQASITAGIATSSSIDLGANVYLVNYPINFTKRGGVLTGASNLIADTGDILLDITGGAFELLRDFSIVTGPTNPSSIAIYCARDTTVNGGLAQNINTYHVSIEGVANNTHALGGRGSVGYYNHACEIEQHLLFVIAADRAIVLTSTDIDHVSSLFDAHDDQTTQSMAGNYIISPSFTSFGPFVEFDNAYSSEVLGGYGFGGNSPSHPWSFEFDGGQSGIIRLDGFRTETKAGGVYIAGALVGPYISIHVFRANQTTAQVYLASGATLRYADMVRVDDFGGSSVPTALIDGAAGCDIQGSNIRIGVWETLGTCQLSGVANTISGLSLAVPSYDYSLNPDYTLAFATTTTWVKLGTWVASGPSGDTLDIRIYSGPGANPGANQQSLADLIVRNANGTAAPNLSGASLLTYGNSPFIGVKVVATGGSTSIANQSWDIYVQETSFAQGTYHIEKQNTAQWINSNITISDPGPASSTVVVGTIQLIVSTPTAASSGTCTPNGFIPMLIGTNTVKVATCL
jgi:hypothetical protein